MVRSYLKRKARPLPPNFLLSLVFVLLLTFVGWFVYKAINEPIEVTDFESCVKAGNPILESYPEQCTHNGQSFINPSQNIPKAY